ncbi:MAG: hypothetical protein AB7K63_01925 [Vicinamibacterales bacterium]
MNILFVARTCAYFRNYDLALRELAARGHSVHLAVAKGDSFGGREAVETLVRECPGITFGELPDRGGEPWADFARRLRLGLDYLRYLEPFYDDAPLRRNRARERTPRLLVALAELGRGRRWQQRVRRWLHAVDLAVPVSPVLEEYLRQRQPDAVLITPMVELGSPQVDLLRAAKRLGIPTALPVFSWDHLATKALLREYPERLFVWNETQRREAVTVHGVPPDRVVVTGAQCFDHWFGRTPSRTREAFCAQLGLPADRPIILYACTGFVMGSPPEPPFIREWLQRVRGSADPAVAGASVLVRPHPSEMAAWEGFDLGDAGPLAFWGGNPIDRQSRDDYFDSLYHCAAVVGINTSAFIEAGIVGRDVLAIVPGRTFHDTQDGSRHFRYLLESGGGLLQVSRDFDTHLAQLSRALSRRSTGEHPHRAFLESFVRPAGVERPATPTFVAAVEQLRGTAVAAGDLPRPGLIARFARNRLAASAAAPSGRAWWLSALEREREARRDAKVRSKGTKAKAGQPV